MNRAFALASMFAVFLVGCGAADANDPWGLRTCAPNEACDQLSGSTVPPLTADERIAQHETFAAISESSTGDVNPAGDGLVLRFPHIDGRRAIRAELVFSLANEGSHPALRVRANGRGSVSVGIDEGAARTIHVDISTMIHGLDDTLPLSVGVTPGVDILLPSTAMVDLRPRIEVWNSP